MNKAIEFLRKKDYKYINEIGQGGTGRTILIFDENINEYFVCKKYSPYYEEDKIEYYTHFVSEIKLLHLIYHKNIVRIFNYYLYPEKTTGYILMEYIEGQTINKYVKFNPDRINELFTETIEAFKYLEENNILHRDIRPENIMVTSSGNVKVIDLGFGKKINFDDSFNKSISLNWRYSPPKDFTFQIYNFKTEIYFLGKLFEEIIIENDIKNFLFSDVLNRMIKHDQNDRINSFFDVDREIISEDAITVEFSDVEKATYQRFAYNISLLFNQIHSNSEYISNINTIIDSLSEIYKGSMLETTIQNPILVAKSFIRGEFTYLNTHKIPVNILNDFLLLLKKLSPHKQKIILNNLWQRLDAKVRYSNEWDDLPF
jgi:serine/threonine protein kinase